MTFGARGTSKSIGKSRLTDLELYNLVLSRCLITENSCWIYQGGSSGLYGYITNGRQKEYTHVFMWEFQNGPKKKPHLHHTKECTSKKCCNPAHLWNVTRSEHMRLHHGNWPKDGAKTR